MSATGEPGCEGTWYEVHRAEDGDMPAIRLLRCNGCGEWMGIAGYRGMGTFPATMSIQEVARAVVHEYIAGRN